MGEARFFHLTHSSAEFVVRENATRAMAMGWNVVVRGTQAQALAQLDERLWLLPEDSFLPHGMAGGDHDGDQPMLLTAGPDIPNGAKAIFALDGAEVAPAEVASMERVWILFDGNDPQALEVARNQWRSLTGAGVVAEYWSEASGRWQMQTSSRKA